MTKVKFCGIKSIEDIKMVSMIKPDYIGFVFVNKSKRYVSIDDAKKLKRNLSEDILTIGVFQNEDISHIMKIIEENIIDGIQLHGQESIEYIKELKTKTNLPIIQAFPVTSIEDIKQANQSIADYILLDHPNSGHGMTFDWTFLLEMKRPYFLAGGLTVENVKDVIKIYHPYAVDVSSGIESEGKKDFHKMDMFMKEVKSINTSGGYYEKR